jgi:hypothetical protein
MLTHKKAAAGEHETKLRRTGRARLPEIRALEAAGIRIRPLLDLGVKWCARNAAEGSPQPAVNSSQSTVDRAGRKSVLYTHGFQGSGKGNPG